MRFLVHSFIVVAALALGAAGYFALAFTPIEAGLTALVCWGLCIIVLDRGQRRRSEDRLERAVDDLARLLSTDAQAGQVLSQRINELAAVNAEDRLAVLEADISVLGTVVRQVAEAVTEMEVVVSSLPAAPENPPEDEQTDVLDPAGLSPPRPSARTAEPRVPLEQLKTAIADGRLVFHSMPIITLPQRRTYGYDLVPRLKLEDGEIADAPDFMPLSGGAETICDIEWRGIEEAVMVVRRATSAGGPLAIAAPVSRAVLADAKLAERLIDLFDANRAVARRVTLRMAEADWRDLEPPERTIVSTLRDKGVGFSLTRARSLRLDFDELARRGVTSVRVSAEQFVDTPASLTDYHSSDIADYIARFEIALIAENVTSEQQLLAILEDGVKYAQGPHIARPAPIRPDMLVRRDAVVTGQRAS